MNRSVEELYLKAKRFDEGDLCQSREYHDICAKKSQLYKEMLILFGPTIAKILEEYTAVIGDECDCENRHFFEQGYLSGCVSDGSLFATGQNA